MTSDVLLYVCVIDAAGMISEVQMYVCVIHAAGVITITYAARHLFPTNETPISHERNIDVMFVWEKMI